MTRRAAALAAVALLAAASAPFAAPSTAETNELGRFGLEDVFELEWASDPQIAPDGGRVVYVRQFMDKMKDRRRGHLWIVELEGGAHRPLTSGAGSARSPRWSPTGDRLAYVAEAEGKPQIHVRYMDTGQTAVLSRLTEAPRNLRWSPDGRWIAFTMKVGEPPEPFVRLPRAPEGAEWAPPPRLVRALRYRQDGEGYLEPGVYEHVFVLSADGGTPRRLTTGPYDHGQAPAWTPDGRFLIVAANRHPEGEYDPRNTELYEVALADGALRALTSRHGPDAEPAVSPDGRWIAYTGFDDRYQGYQVSRLSVLDRSTGASRTLADGLDRSVSRPIWRGDGTGVYVQYDDRGDTKIGFVPLEGSPSVVAESVGGTSIGRPYSGGSFSAAADGTIAYTFSRPDRPADVAVVRPGGAPRVLTALNEDLLGPKRLGRVEAIEFASSFDGRTIQGWVVTPPDFDPSRDYPLILEIHGGPFANYGPRFAAEIQLYAAAGYVVLYVNPRGSTSYGEEFGNLIHHAYPGHDYDDLMSGVDAVLEKGIVDPDRLYVTGGSGGGVLTAWIVGKTDRFRAAVAAKPVINWYSFVLTADAYPVFTKYWFPGPPWEQTEHYMRRSPIALVGNVSTPTMLLTGEEDHRTPISETEQFYQALKLRKVDTAMVRVPGASHGIANRPSQLIAKVAYILEWFARHGGREETARRPTAAR